ncbi:addiction module protein [Gloeothece verrucosa]|uniref:Putative addiction module component CHP02574 family protein n=1 Tax=Gloeothece verrucosa (strain PCC 7822) TaxID=497965 RepID=E0U9R5_GLOV7|nr:addiction module protein [Gloeothece verrucosa]ADN14985.1 Putative addiction module component CHP02574 family protein [Gloeothece verrucosa PCC 7822]
MLSIEELMQEALSLPSAERALLAEKLVESLVFDVDGKIETLWTTEAKRRRDEIRNGTVEVISGEQALAAIKKIVKETLQEEISKLDSQKTEKFLETFGS